MSNMFNPWQNQLMQQQQNLLLQQQQQYELLQQQQQKLHRQQMLQVEAQKNSLKATTWKYDICNYLRSRREAMGISQEDLATMSGIQLQDVIKIELNGTCDAEKLFKVIAALQLNIQLY